MKQAENDLRLIDNLNKFVIGARAWAVPDGIIIPVMSLTWNQGGLVIITYEIMQPMV